MKTQPLPFQALSEFKTVSRIEVKRCYVTAQYFRWLDRGKTRYLRELSREEFTERLQKSKKFVHQLTEAELDQRIADDYPKRLKTYNVCDWYEGTVSVDEVGVWRGAGGLPVAWTQGSLAETAEHVNDALQSNSKLRARARRIIPRITPNLHLIEAESYLLPIIAPGATMGRGRNGVPFEHFRHLPGDIDDGCMRSITLAVNGRTHIHAYVGLKPPKKTRA